MKDGKITVDDFKNDSTIEQMRLTLGSINSKDLAGYTPLCFAVLNGIAPEIIVALVNDHSASTSIASKGKSPMQTACQAMNVNAVKALIGEEIEYIETDDNGNPKQAYIDCLPAYIKDEEGNDTEEPLPLKNKVSIEQSKRCEITDADILSASILSKEDILKAILEYKNTRLNLTKIVDKNKNNPLHLACIAQCYGSVDLLYTYRSTNDDFKKAAEKNNNSDGKTPIEIAEDSGDGTLVAKLREYCGISLEYIIRFAFAQKQNDVINDILINNVSSVRIYEYYDRTYKWGPLSDYTLVTVAKYIDEENNEDLYELLLQQYSSDRYTYFKDGQHYNILAYLCYKNKSPLTAFDKIFEEFTTPDDYTSIVKSMFINDWVDIDKICDITDESTRNNCIYAIFTGDFNNESFIKLIECNSTYRSNIVRSLYQSGYFTFNDIISLIGYTQDNYLYRLIDDLDTLIELDQIFSISSEYEDFKTGLIAYLYGKNKVTLSDIESEISDSDYKASVIVYLFTSQHISLSDVLTSTHLNNTTKHNVVNKLCENDITILDEIFSVAFENNLTSIIDYALKNIVKSDTIYEWYNKSYHWQYASGQLKSIAKYCNDHTDSEENNLRNLFVDNFDSSKHLKTLTHLRCSKIIALLYKNSKITLSDICSVQDDNTQQVIDDLYEDEEFTLQSLVNSGLSKDKVFNIILSMASDNKVTIDEINNEITDNEFKSELLEYLHDKGAFNIAPIAVLSEYHITVSPGDIVELDASSSSDPDNDPISFLWSGDYSYLLDDITSSKPKFTVPADLSSSTDYTFTVTVSDSFGLSDSASATVSVYIAENHAPTVVLAQSSFVTAPGSTVILDASESSDPDGDDISFTWSGEYVYLLEDIAVGKKQFTIPSNLQSTFTYTFTVTVTDTHGASDSKNITVTANVQPNQAPVVVIDDVFEGQPGDIIELDASSSYDPDNDPISYTWEGAYASQLVCTNPAKPKFTIPSNAIISSEYKFTAKVTDNRGASSSKLVTVRVPSVIGILLFTTGTFAAETEIPEAAEQLYNHYRERGLEIKENFNLIYDEDAIVTE